MGICGFDPANLGTYVNLTDADLTGYSTTGIWSSAISLNKISSGKFYFEVEAIYCSGNQLMIGVANENFDEETYPGGDANSWGYSPWARKYYNASWTSYGSTYAADDIIQVAVDISAGKIWWGKNDSWNGDPAAGTGEAYSGLSGNDFYAMVGFYGSPSQARATISINPDDFTYTPPSGFSEIPCSPIVEDDFGIADVIDAQLMSGYVEDGFGIADVIDASNLSGQIEDDFGIADEADAVNLSSIVEDDFGIADEADAIGEFNIDQADDFGIADQVAADAVYNVDLSDSLGIADSCDAFNWTEWLALNKFRAITRYFFTLTGSNDATTDIEIPISSFQARKRSGEATYLSVTIPNYVDYASEIVARPNGEMVLEMAFELDGEISIREEILRVDLEIPSLYRGPSNRSILLSGHKTQSFSSKIVTLDDPSYVSDVSGDLLYRFPVPDPYLNPGDTLVVGSDSFTVGLVTYIVAENSVMMEVREA